MISAVSFQSYRIAIKKLLESLPRQTLVASLARIVDVQENTAAVDFRRNFACRTGASENIKHQVSRLAGEGDATQNRTATST